MNPKIMISDAPNNSKKIQANNKFQAKLSWKRIEALKLMEQIKSFIDDNFGIELPKYRKDYNDAVNRANKGIAEADQIYLSIDESCRALVKTYYTLNDFGLSVASLFEQDSKLSTFTLGHIYSKHRIDPVWNWRKSQLIRSIYKNYLFANTDIIKNFHPVHCVLTLPHPGGLYKGSQFYAKELIEAFRELRRSKAFKSAVYAGEYGIEVKASKTGNGLHIHIHSLIFLRKKTQCVNDFRDKIEKNWRQLTGATQIWVETLYFYKKDNNNNTIQEFKNGKLIPKKFYVDKEASAIKADIILNAEEKQKMIVDTYLYGILECIKYHFKNYSLLDKGGKYNIGLVNDILANTQNKRLYSRFGKFYKEPSLCFNHLEQSGDDDILSEVQEVAINPYTGEELNSQDTQLVSFLAHKQKRAPASSVEPFSLINCKDGSIYNNIAPGKTVKEVMSELLKAKFGKAKMKNNFE